MSLVAHAKSELRAAGVFEEDPEFAQSIVNAVAGFASYGHSGGSAGVGIMMVHDLLQFKPLGPLTNRPDEWMDVAESYGNQEAVWQSRRQSSCFSNDGGVTYYNIDEKQAWWRRFLLRRTPGWKWAKHHEAVPV